MKKAAPAEQGPAAPNPNFARVDIEVAVPALSDLSSKCGAALPRAGRQKHINDALAAQCIAACMEATSITCCAALS